MAIESSVRITKMFNQRVGRSRISNAFTFRALVNRVSRLILALTIISVRQCHGQKHEDRLRLERPPATSADSIDRSHPIGMLLSILAEKNPPAGEDGSQTHSTGTVPRVHNTRQMNSHSGGVIYAGSAKSRRPSGEHKPAESNKRAEVRVEGANSPAQLPSLFDVNCVEFYAAKWRDATDIEQRVYHPLTLPVPVKIKEHDEINEYDAVMTFGREGLPEQPTENLFYVLVVDTPSDFNKGQTWRVHDVLNFTPLLPKECWHAEYLLPSQALTQSRDRIIFYNFGYQPGCSKLVMYNPSSRQIHKVRMSNKQSLQIPNLYVSLAFAKSADSNGIEALYLFGGLFCYQEDVDNCRNASNDTFRFDFVDDNMTKGKWSRLSTSVNQRSPPMSARFSASLFAGEDTDIYMYGGLSVAKNNMTLRYNAECDLWLLNSTTREWSRITRLEMDCKARSSLGCLSRRFKAKYSAAPLRALCAYSRVRDEIVVVTMSATALAFQQCVVEKFAISTYRLAQGNSGIWRHQSTTKKFGITSYGKESVDILTFSVVADTISNNLFLVIQKRLRLHILQPSERPANGTLQTRALSDLSYEYRFPGSVGCYAPFPVAIDINRNSQMHQVEKPYVLLGGYCYQPTVNVDSYHLPVWQGIPVWTYFRDRRPVSVITGYYEMRIISPGPRSPHRMFHTVTPISSHWAALYGGVSSIERQIDPGLWCFNSRDFYWLEANATAGEIVTNVHDSAYAGHVAYPYSDKTGSVGLVIYGGVPIHDALPFDAIRVTNHMYVFEFTNISSCEGYWTNVTDKVHGSGGRSLPALAFHSATTFNNQTFIYGGLELEYFLWDIPAILFTLSVTRRRDYIVKWEPIPLSPSMYNHARFGHTLSVYTPGMLLVLGGMDRACLLAYGGCPPTTTAFLLQLPRTGGNATLTPFFSSHSVAFHQTTADRFVFGGALIYKTDHYQSKEIFSRLCFSRIRPNCCPLGQHLMRKTSTCESCPVNQMSNDLGSDCIPCGQYQITNGNGSTECLDPGPCYFTKDYCHQRGHCYYDNETKQLGCICTAHGYWEYDNCFFPMTQIISSTCILVSIGLVLCLVAIIRKIKASRRLMRKRKEALDVSQWKLKELANGVIIDWRDLRVISALGRGSSGKVDLAQFGDMQVAVKTLRQCSDNIFLQNFSKEIENMRTVRHSNIVMFLGAGTMPASHVPFIVMEYVMRGSLFKLLHNESIDISHINRITFALDTARGMEYLHGMKTPRLHCDLKSSNLLVTGDGKIKIADFGMLRLVSTIRRIRDRDEAGEDTDEENGEEAKLMASYTVRDISIRSSQERGRPCQQPGVRRTSSFATASSSQETNVELLTEAMGTSRWCSPETLRSGVFNKYTDVYR